MEIELLHEILDKHAKWLNNEAGGVRADLQDVNLRNADLQGTNLRNADLRHANLWHANLRNTDLRNADLQGANLWHANLQGADLRGANLWYADLQDSNLQYTSLSWVNWHEARNIKVYVAGLQSSRENVQLTYIPSLDVATTGCWQGTWQATIEQIHSVYDEGTRECKAYDLAIEYIENQMELDGVEVEK